MNFYKKIFIWDQMAEIEQLCDHLRVQPSIQATLLQLEVDHDTLLMIAFIDN